MAGQGRVKGITIELGGDTIKLQEALKEVNAKTKKVQNSLKDINKLLKFDPKNTDLLKQKQEQLKNVIESSSEKLSKLKAIEKELAKDQGQKEKWEIIKREIISTEQELKNYESQQRKLREEMSIFHKMGTQVSKVGESFEKAGKKLIPISAGITAIGVASNKAWSEIDEMLDTVATKTGAMGENLQELQEVAKEVYQSEVAPSALDAGNAVGELNTRLGFTGEVLKEASVDFLKFATITGQDVNSAVILVTRSMGDAGIPAQKYKEVLDALTVAGQQSGIEVGKLADMLTKFGAPMRQLGFDFKESIALFSTWEKAGVNTEIAFSGMKKAIGNWAKEGKDAKEEFKKMLEEIQRTPTLAEATTKAIEVFGQKAGPDLADAIKGGRFEFNEMLKFIKKSENSLSNTFENVYDPIDKVKQSFNSIKLAGAELADVAMKILTPVFKTLAEKAKSLSSWFSALSDRQKEMIIQISGIIAAVSPILIILGKVTIGIGRVIDAFKRIYSVIPIFKNLFTKLISFKSLITKLWGLLASHPFIAIGIALAGLVTGLIYAYKHSEKFRQIIDKVFKFVSKTLNQFMNVVKKVWSTIQLTFKIAWDNTILPIMNYLKEKIESLKESFTKFKLDCVNIWCSVWNFLKTSWLIFWNIFKPIFELAWINLKINFEMIWNAIKTIFETVLNSIKIILETVLGIIRGIWDIFAGAFTADWSRVWTGVKGIFSTIWYGIKNLFQTLLNGMLNLARNIFNSIVESIRSIFEKVPQVISNIWKTAENFLRNINLYSIGQNIIQGLINGIGAMGSALWNVAKNIASSCLSAIKRTLGINSPSRKMKEVGFGIGEGLILGIENMKNEVSKSGESLSNAFTKGYEEKQKNFKHSLNGTYNLTTNSNMISKLNDLLTEFNGLKNNMNITVKSVLDGKEIARATWKHTDEYQGMNMKRLRSIRT